MIHKNFVLKLGFIIKLDFVWHIFYVTYALFPFISEWDKLKYFSSPMTINLLTKRIHLGTHHLGIFFTWTKVYFGSSFFFETPHYFGKLFFSRILELIFTMKFQFSMAEYTFQLFCFPGTDYLLTSKQSYYIPIRSR